MPFEPAKTSTIAQRRSCSDPNPGLSRHELRSRSKMVNYAVLYGKTSFTLAKDINVTQEAAQEFIDAYFTGFPQRARLHRSHAGGGPSVRRGENDVRASSPDAEPDEPQLPDARQAEREAVNMPIQGTAADILKRAMIDLHAALPATRAQRADDPDRARRVAVRVRARRCRSDVGVRARTNGRRGLTQTCR